MTSQLPVVAGAEPFSADGTGDNGRIGVLVSHGFTGSPFSMRPWGEHLAAAGYTVRLPRLPGHGTTWQDLNRTKWTDWYAEVRKAYLELAGRCDAVFCCGLSMGGALMLRLAEEFAQDDKLAGLVLVNPAIAIARKDAQFAKYIAWAVPSRPGIGNDIKKSGVTEHGYDKTPLRAFVSMQDMWRLIRADLGKIRAPILYFHSTEDHVVDPLSGQLLHAGAVNTSVTEIALENSFHVATLDNDAPIIFERSVEFIQSRVRA
ncbi:MAG TPA: alpha/beta fold hydrolase [Jatrophihabitans sp.]|nr:alpha/beta fold hydrolase [Jatrophihabitans sp.]